MTESQLRKEKLFENKFLSLVKTLGVYQIKIGHSNLLMSYYKIKLNCKSANYSYQTVVVGDEFDDEAEAKENAFKKAYHVLRKEYNGKKWNEQSTSNAALTRKQSRIDFHHFTAKI